jgi:hypothetical protein
MGCSLFILKNLAALPEGNTVYFFIALHEV